MDKEGDSQAPGTPAEALVGMQLEGGWNVVEHVPRRPGDTGGTFSQSYLVEREGQGAFLKAFDYSSALSQPNTADVLQALLSAYIFERDLLIECSGMSRVVLSLGAGEVDVPGYGILSKVNYLILEPAQRDARQHRDLLRQLDLAWTLRSLHHVATGLSQLHGRRIAHQDLKPSNVLVFDDESAKVGDLGRASWEGHAAPHDAFPLAGDKNYAPPELLYRYYLPDELARRLACDLYHLGSIGFYMFDGAGTTGALAAELDPELEWGNWTGTYEEVLPYLIDAFEVLAERLGGEVPEQYSARVVAIFRELCTPDVHLRGDLKERVGSRARLLLRRYVSRLDLMAREAELGLRRAV